MHTVARLLAGVFDHRDGDEPLTDPIRVLVVDDNPADARLIAHLLEDGPYSCATVSSYEEGLEVIRQGAHDAYLIDYRLGNRTGLELIQEISNAASGPLILLTGLDDPALDELAQAAGASDYLDKTRLTFEDVTRSIRYAVETWKARRAAEVDRERFRALYEGVPIGIGRLSIHGIFTEANQFLTNLCRYPDGESLIGKAVAELLDRPGDADTLLARSSEGDTPVPFELRMKRHDGTHIWVGGALSAHKGPNGEVSEFEAAIGDITARKTAEEKVALQGAILDQVGSAVVMTDLSGEVTFWNGHAEEVFGWNSDEVMGRPIGEITVPLTSADETAEIMRVIGETGHWAGEYDALRRDGSTVPLFVTDTLISDADGLPVAIVGISTDITGRRAAEAEIRFQASLLDQVSNAVIATDLAGIVIYWNRYAEQLLGWSADEVMGRNPFDATTRPLIDPAEFATERGTAIFSAGKWEGEITVLKRDGSSFPAWSSHALLRDQKGAPVGVVQINVDLTQQKQSQADAKRQGELARSVLEAIPYPQMVLSSEGLILAVNKAEAALLEREGLLGENGGIGIDFLDLCQKFRPEGLAVGIASILDGTSTSYKQDFSDPTGETTDWFRMEVNPVPGTGAVVARWDITDEHNARGVLEELIRAKDEFIASVSHELRTPLTAVVGLTHELSQGRVRLDEVPELQTVIAQQAQEVSDIVEDLLVAARASADSITIRPSPFYLRTQVDLVVRPWLRGDVNSIDVTAVHPNLVCRGDAGRVRQILRNLVANAVRYGAKPVSVEAETDGATVTIRVQDHGPGIPTEAVERMFEPYARLGGLIGLPSSVGLGLYVSRLLARMMGGDLQYKRADGVTEFSLTLPVERRREPLAGIDSGQ